MSYAINRIGYVMEESLDWMHMLETKQIINCVYELDLLHNVRFILGAVLFIAVSLYMRWHLLLTTTLSLTALITIATMVTEQGTDLEKSSDGIFMFIGGGAAVMFFLIYMIFMRGD